MQIDDANAIAALIERHGSALVLYARGLCDRPDDVVQEAFVQLIRCRELPEQPAPWLFRVVRNLAYNNVRSDIRRRKYETQSAATRQTWFENNLEDAAIADEAVLALKELGPAERETVVAKIWGQLSFEQIAELTGCSISTAHRRYQSGIRHLQQRFSERAGKPSTDTDVAGP